MAVRFFVRSGSRERQHKVVAKKILISVELVELLDWEHQPLEIGRRKTDARRD